VIQIVTDPQVPSHILAEWAIARLPNEDLKTPADLGPYHAFGVLKDGKPACVVIYNWFRQMEFGHDVRVIIVSENPGWCLPGVLRELFSYPFVYAGCERITAVIKDGNERSLKLCKGLGFRREGVMRRAHNGKTNAILLGMLKDECKWLKGRKQETTNVKKVPFRSEAGRSEADNRGPGASKQRRDNRVVQAGRNRPVRTNGLDGLSA
jgi:hypothetical protein